MKQLWKSPYLRVLLAVLLMVGLLCTGCASDNGGDNTASQAPAQQETQQQPQAAEQETAGITEDGTYTAAQDVADYLHRFGHLPNNYITKSEAKDLGWDNQKGNLDEVAPGMSIGGDSFGNREGLLPKEKGRKYYECDINYDGGYRNGERIIFSNDGLIFYTGDHYKTFEQLY